MAIRNSVTYKPYVTYVSFINDLLFREEAEARGGEFDLFQLSPRDTLTNRLRSDFYFLCPQGYGSFQQPAFEEEYALEHR